MDLFFDILFEGISIGSVLLIAALGLAIVFGLMGVINLAWEYCCQKEKMHLVNKFLSEEKLS